MLSVLGYRGGARSPQLPRAALVFSRSHWGWWPKGLLLLRGHVASKSDHTAAVGEVIAIPRSDPDKAVTGGKANPSTG